jgi:hypothetical protein
MTDSSFAAGLCLFLSFSTSINRIPARRVNGPMSKRVPPSTAAPARDAGADCRFAIFAKLVDSRPLTVAEFVRIQQLFAPLLG